MQDDCAMKSDVDMARRKGGKAPSIAKLANGEKGGVTKSRKEVGGLGQKGKLR
jgi:hypothetical protein